MKRAVFLDRDGVLNRAEVRDGKSYAPRRLAEFRLFPRVAEAVQGLREAGLVIVVVTNQPDIGAGRVSLETVEAMHERLRGRIPVDAIEVCPHVPQEGCTCRKPSAGMLLAAADRIGIDLQQSFMVGDRYTDILAGERAGCRTVLIHRGCAGPRLAEPDLVATSLPLAARWILGLTGKGHPGRYST